MIRGSVLKVYIIRGNLFEVDVIGCRCVLEVDVNYNRRILEMYSGGCVFEVEVIRDRYMFEVDVICGRCVLEVDVNYGRRIMEM